MCLSHHWETETAVISAQHKQHKSSVVEFCYKLQNWEEKGQLQDVYHLMPYIETAKKTSQTISFTCLHNSYRHLGTLKFKHPAWVSLLGWNHSLSSWCPWRTGTWLPYPERTWTMPYMKKIEKLCSSFVHQSQCKTGIRGWAEGEIKGSLAL